jgi:hypothetical protein
VRRPVDRGFPISGGFSHDAVHRRWNSRIDKHVVDVEISVEDREFEEMKLREKLR